MKSVLHQWQTQPRVKQYKNRNNVIVMAISFTSTRVHFRIHRPHLLGPTFFAASIYMVLGRLIRLLEAEEHSMIRTTWLTKVFLLGDILSFLSQSGGGGMPATAKDKAAQDLGNNIILSGLGIQVVFFAFFMIVTVVFHTRINRRPTATSLATSAPWRRSLWVLYFASVLILVRSLFRMMKYAQGSDGVLM
ncbi:hypothetical protein NX059_000677 [Plenodomus lindquistii]|nr:hypothetical protein NX059_000677 [Plenodomus lindquistii]